jgi:hypothetical protein
MQKSENFQMVFGRRAGGKKKLLAAQQRIIKRLRWFAEEVEILANVGKAFIYRQELPSKSI